jgi:hypothetical protein
MNFGQVLGLAFVYGQVCWAAYSETKAIEYANFAGAAYCLDNTLTEWNCGDKCTACKKVTDVRVCHGSASKAFVGHWDGRCLISFEGTSGMSAVAVDADFLTVPFLCEGCRAHKGYSREWYSMSDCVTSKLTEIGCDTTKPLHATGHSMGAGMVSLAMFYLQTFPGYSVAEIYNFGSPRFGNPTLALAFQDAFRGKFYRVTHGRDPFVDMPPPSAGSYQHAEPEVFYKGDVKQGHVICTDISDKRCSAQYFPEWMYGMEQSSPVIAYHHTYMGVDTTSGGCVNVDQRCDEDIQVSWCSYGIPCNADKRGPSHCNYGPAYKGGYGKCHCNEGYCPNEFGHCDPKSVASSMSSSGPNATSVRSSSHIDASESKIAPVIVLVSSLMVCGLLGTFAAKLKSCNDASKSDYYLAA